QPAARGSAAGIKRANAAALWLAQPAGADSGQQGYRLSVYFSTTAPLPISVTPVRFMGVALMPDSSDSPEPATNGDMLRCSSSSRPASTSARLKGPLPYFTNVPSPDSLSWATASMASPASSSAFHAV